MEQNFVKLFEYLAESGIVTLNQLFILFGPLLLLTMVMDIIARLTVRLSYQIMGERVYLYIFGWLGTAVHELGHALFALIFGHKIEKIKLFTPNSGKSLGHVEHRYSSKNPYQTSGNFFIGIGPVLLGAILLFLVSFFLFKINVFRIAEENGIVISFEIFTSFETLKSTGINIGKGITEYVKFVFTNTNWWKTVLFFYLFYSVGSSMRLSTTDIKSTFRGFLYMVLLLFLFNAATLWAGSFVLDFLHRNGNYFSGFCFLILLGICINLIFLVLFQIIKLLKALIFRS